MTSHRQQNHDVTAVDPIRSRIMAAIRQKNTGPEMVVRQILHRLGLRFRLHRKGLPGTPDIVLPRHRTVIFVHGCFWHRHQGCRKASTPNTRAEFWQEKFDQNVLRDTRNERALFDAGWRVLVVWECETKDMARLIDRLKADFAVSDSFNPPQRVVS